ncbi:epididymal-specific lipocalin-5-like isoform X1 [Bos javanicus]|uniref:epididymal-specific lipocalin-5-like isoform X1 n=1 Tax=Bos javanicus TaxID=9906 RepID=UPI002AA902C2|nr:epididymal-specific lipocalin-5-like isoform X1 [Bos javanicus]XP_061290177.1 epididymal-specific lipocalin-5-like isoform X1 [Bos javanicus]
MRGNLLAALLGLLVVLAAGKEDLGFQNFSLTQFSGMWYEIALASNLEHQSSSPRRKVGAVIVEQDGPHLSLTSVSDHMNLCMKEKNQAVKGDAPGKFKIPLESGGKEVIVVATDYKTYAIMNIILNRGGKPSSVLKLYSRTLEHNEKATEKFVEKAVEQGLSVSNVQLLTKDLTCVNLLS